MGQSSASNGWIDPPHCRFELAPPRHFVYPAILLLLSEKPRHGYRLIDPLGALGFGTVDRPTVYRALGDLERDGLLESWDAEPKAGATRHVYAVTASGRLALERWMAVLTDERDQLDAVLERYTLLDHDPRVRVPTGPSGEPPAWPAPSLHLSGHDGRDVVTTAVQDDVAAWARTSGAPVTPTVFDVRTDVSAIMIRARSNVGSIEFGTTAVRGRVEAVVQDGAVVASSGVSGRLQVDIADLTSGNSLYDAELRRRVDARAYPTAVIDLDEACQQAAESRFDVGGTLTFHGSRVSLDGSVSVALVGDQRLVVSGERMIDIRDFGLAAPTMLMLRIYPEVRVYLHLEAEAVTTRARATGTMRKG